ncbi:unnamed protein product [Mytilus edulis]|uniref:Uncharacterized protein n=1 Tax=Mytilus edulis TaxID=6550 RepID=A0A8S3T502_MYTED|nr:unnamed protein product [Mytilus edulis]
MQSLQQNFSTLHPKLQKSAKRKPLLNPPFRQRSHQRNHHPSVRNLKNPPVERFHRTLHDVMAKKLQSDASTWDVCLNQTIAAIRFQKNESTKFSPFFLLYNRDPVLPIDNLLKPRRKYVGEDPHKILLEQQHKSFILVHRNLKKSKEKQKQNADKNRQEINLEIGDPVYFKNHLRKSKLDTKWKPYYRIIEKTSPVTFVLKNQLDGSVAKKVHLEHLKKAKIDEWVIPTNLEETFRSPSEVGNINIKPSMIVGWIITSKVISEVEEHSLYYCFGRFWDNHAGRETALSEECLLPCCTSECYRKVVETNNSIHPQPEILKKAMQAWLKKSKDIYRTPEEWEQGWKEGTKFDGPQEDYFSQSIQGMRHGRPHPLLLIWRLRDLMPGA